MTACAVTKEPDTPLYLEKSACIGKVPVPLYRDYDPKTHDLGSSAADMLTALDTAAMRALEPMDVSYASMTLAQLGFAPDKEPSFEEVRNRVQEIGGRSCHELLALPVWNEPFGGTHGRFLMYPVDVEGDPLVFEIHQDTGRRSLRGISLKRVRHWRFDLPVIFQIGA